MTRDQILLLQLLVGKALDAALTKVRRMSPDEISVALKKEENRTAELLQQMREA